MAGSIPLHPTGVVSNKAIDFKITSQDGVMGSVMEGLARRWLDAMLNSDNPSITVLQREGESWWLMHFRKDRAFDEHGRQNAAALLGKLPKAPLASRVESLLKNYADACHNQTKAPASVPEGAPRWPSSEDAPEVGQAALALALGHNAAMNGAHAVSAVLRRDGSEQQVDSRALGLGALQWVARHSGSPPNAPPPGPGLFLGGKPLRPPSAAAHCFAACARPVFDMRLGELAFLPHDTATKTLLLKKALSVGQDPLPSDLSPEALAWLTYFPNSRKDAFELVQPDGFVAFLDKLDLESATFDELNGLKNRLNLGYREYGPKISNFLERMGALGLLSQDAFDAYHELFPDDRHAQVGLLGDDAREVWEGLCGDGHALAARKGHVTALFERLNGKAFDCPFTLEGLAWAAETREPRVRAAFQKKLTEEGVPDALAAAMLEEGEPLADAGPAGPTLQPAWSWLRAVRPFQFLRRCRSAPREWWLAGVALLFQKERLPRDHLMAEAIQTADQDLLALVEAGSDIRKLVDPKGGRVQIPVPEGEWHPTADRLIEKLYQTGGLWNRLQPPLTSDGMDWLVTHLKRQDMHNQLKDRFRRLRAGTAVSERRLLSLAPLLEGKMVLDQVARIAQSPLSADRQRLLAALLHLDCLEPAKREWLRTFVLTCRQLPRAPDWSAKELKILLPILEPVEHVVRIVMDREAVDDEGERALLSKLVERLKPPGRTLPPPAPNEEQRSRRPEWFQELAPLLGWLHPDPGVSRRAAAGEADFGED